MHSFLEKQLEGHASDGFVTAAFLGDSVTHGCFGFLPGNKPDYDYDAVYHNRFRAMVQEWYSTKPVAILNAGINGDNAGGGLRRLERDVIRHAPDLCVVNFGLNDVNWEKDKYAANMRGIFTQLRAAGIPTVFLTCNMLNTYVNPDVVPPFYRQYAEKMANVQLSGRLDEYLDAAREEAHHAGALICDCNAVWHRMASSGLDTTAMLANGINHPRRDLHGLFAGYLMRTLLDN